MGSVKNTCMCTYLEDSLMDRDAVLALFDEAMRADPAGEAAARSAWAGDVLRRGGPLNYIEWWTLDEASAPAAVAREAAHFRELKEPVEWKVYGHDRPAGLTDELARAGFAPDPVETFMAFDLADGTPQAPPPAPGLEIRQVSDLAELADFTQVGALAFGLQTWRPLGFETRLADPTLALYVAYLDGEPAASGRLDLPPGRPFAGLYGGGVAPAFRGLGIYRALVAARAEVARRAGYRYLTVDAADTSRPILHRLGFEALTTVQGWVLGG